MANRVLKAQVRGRVVAEVAALALHEEVQRRTVAADRIIEAIEGAGWPEIYNGIQAFREVTA